MPTPAAIVPSQNMRRYYSTRECKACRQRKHGIEFSSSSPVCIDCCRALHLVGMPAIQRWVKKHEGESA